MKQKFNPNDLTGTIIINKNITGAQIIYVLCANGYEVEVGSIHNFEIYINLKKLFSPSTTPNTQNIVTTKAFVLISLAYAVMMKNLDKIDFERTDFICEFDNDLQVVQYQFHGLNSKYVCSTL